MANISNPISEGPHPHSDVLPTGRNTYQFDPRMVPTEAAYTRGAEIAENTISHYYKNTVVTRRAWPLSCGGSETSKTQGETIGQILRYLGFRVVRKKVSGISNWGYPLENWGGRASMWLSICAGFSATFFPM